MAIELKTDGYDTTLYLHKDGCKVETKVRIDSNNYETFCELVDAVTKVLQPKEKKCD